MKSIPIPASDPKFWVDIGDGQARWYRAISYKNLTENRSDGDECFCNGEWIDAEEVQIYRTDAYRRPLADPPWEEMAECLKGADGLYRHPVEEWRFCPDRETAEEWLKALGNSQAALDGSGKRPHISELFGQWPVDETDGEIEDAMREIGITGDGKSEQPVADGGRVVFEAREFDGAVEVYQQAKRRTEAERNHLAVHPAHLMAAVERAWAIQQQLAAERAEAERLRAKTAEQEEELENLTSWNLAIRKAHVAVLHAIKRAHGYKHWPSHEGVFIDYVVTQVESLKSRAEAAESQLAAERAEGERLKAKLRNRGNLIQTLAKGFEEAESRAEA